jgi:hypothetical protein
VKQDRHRVFEKSTEASAENRDALGRPLPKLPAPPALAPASNPKRAWERVLARGHRRATLASINSRLRLRRPRSPIPQLAAPREPVRQFRGLGLMLHMAGLAAWPALWWAYDLGGAVLGAGVFTACHLVGRAKSKPWRCGNCRSPLTTAKVRVCPRCGARLVDLDAVKAMPR